MHSTRLEIAKRAYSEKNGGEHPVQLQTLPEFRVKPDTPKTIKENSERIVGTPTYKNLTHVAFQGKSMRILIAEDDRIIADGLGRSLRHAGYAVDWVANGADADNAVTTGSYDLLILDLGLPRMPGLDVLRRLRARKSKLPVLILTALDGTSDRVKGLDLGADDYMAKPFELPELEARVRALTRRSTGTAPVIQFGALAFDQTDRCALLNGEMLDLSARELGLLEMLMLRAGRLVSKDQLVEHLCGWGEEVSHNAIEVYVHRLRKKLETSGATITTVRGLGYCFEKSAQEAKS